LVACIPSEITDPLTFTSWAVTPPDVVTPPALTLPDVVTLPALTLPDVVTLPALTLLVEIPAVFGSPIFALIHPSTVSKLWFISDARAAEPAQKSFKTPSWFRAPEQT
jgi:hypothetical protein